jgi:hypothetical protein
VVEVDCDSGRHLDLQRRKTLRRLFGDDVDIDVDVDLDVVVDVDVDLDVGMGPLRVCVPRAAIFASVRSRWLGRRVVQLTVQRHNGLSIAQPCSFLTTPSHSKVKVRKIRTAKRETQKRRSTESRRSEEGTKTAGPSQAVSSGHGPLIASPREHKHANPQQWLEFRFRGSVQS